MNLQVKLEKLWIGLLTGITIPIIILTIIYFEEKYKCSFVEYIVRVYQEGFMPTIIQFGLIGNLAIFLLTFNTGFTLLPRGILMATIFYGLFIVYMYIW
ncbi:MAG: hypothetical protein ACKVQB_07745 [Bacteroidia bacterium]